MNNRNYSTTRNIGTHTFLQISGLHPEIEGELLYNHSPPMEPAHVYFRRIQGTKLTVVLVHFQSDEYEQMYLRHPEQVNEICERIENLL